MSAEDQVSPSFANAVQNLVESGEGADSENEDLHIAAPQEPKVDPKVYQDVESLIFRGFITASAEINGVRLIFKSLNQHEFEQLQWRVGGSTPADMKRFYAMFLAYGVLAVDGEIILGERRRWLNDLTATFLGLPDAARGKIVRSMSEVNARASRAVTLAEAYAWEPTSRFRWLQIRGFDLTSVSCTGLQGTETLGLNYAQLLWRALSTLEDQKEVAEREWDNAKFIGSCFAGKEIKKIYNKDVKRRQQEREDRWARRDKLIRYALLGEPLDSETNVNGQIMIKANTVEDLARQLERDLRGEKDFHDQVVAECERKANEGVLAKKMELAHLAKERQGTPVPSVTTESKSLTKEEVQERVRQRQQRIAAQESIPVNPLADESMSAFVEKHLENFLASENTYQNPEGTVDLSESRPRGVPFGRRE